MSKLHTWILTVLVSSSVASGAVIVDGEIDTDLVPGPVEFKVLLPDGYDSTKEPFPLLIYLHGGGLDCSLLLKDRAFYEDMWASGIELSSVRRMERRGLGTQPHHNTKP